MSKTYNLVYKTTNKVNGKFYVGVHCTNDLNDGYIGTGNQIKRAKAKYGIENFEREIIMLCESSAEAYELEALIVDTDLVKRRDCYNINPGGAGCPPGVTSGKKRSPETIQRIKDNHRGMTGKKHSEETKRKIGERHRGKIVSDESRLRISKAKKNPSVETRKRISDGQKGKVLSDEHKKKIAVTTKQALANPETRAKMREHRLGQKDSDETRAKKSEARRLWWARKRGEI